MSTAGSDLLSQLMSGDITQAPSETISRVREAVTPAMTELINLGLRARPLSIGGEHVGFVRGVHVAERRQLFSWFHAPADRIKHILKLGSTLTSEEIQDLDGFEAQGLMRLIDQCTDADISLIPYLNAYVSTSTSEILWAGRGAAPAAFSSKTVEIPGGYTFNVMAPPEHARMWAMSATHREKSKRRLDESYNAAMITRAMVGKGADKLFASLKKTQLALISDSDEPWAGVVRFDVKDVNFGDGWGHAHQDDTVEGMLREMNGMETIDKHEQTMNAIYQQQKDEAEAREREIERRLAEAMKHNGIEDSISYMTQAQVDARRQMSRDAQSGADRLVSSALGESAAEDAKKERRSRAPEVQPVRVNFGPPASKPR